MKIKKILTILFFLNLIASLFIYSNYDEAEALTIKLEKEGNLNEALYNYIYNVFPPNNDITGPTIVFEEISEKIILKEGSDTILIALYKSILEKEFFGLGKRAYLTGQLTKLLEKHENFDEAIQAWNDYNKHADNNSWYHDFYRDQGDWAIINLLKKQGKFSEAIKLCNKAMDNPIDVRWQIQLGFFDYYKVGRIKDRLEILADLLEKNEQLYELELVNNQIISICKKYLQESPDACCLNSSVYFNSVIEERKAYSLKILIKKYEKKGDLDQAKLLYQKYINEENYNEDIVINLAELLEKKEGIDIAINFYKEELKKDKFSIKNFLDCRYKLVTKLEELLEKKGNNDEAINLCKEELSEFISKNSSKSTELIYKLITLLKKLDKIDEAINFCEELLKKLENNMAVLKVVILIMAELLVAKNEVEKAINFLEKEELETHINFTINIGEIIEKKDGVESAINFYKKHLNENKEAENLDLEKKLIKFLEKAGHSQEAQELCNRIVKRPHHSVDYGIVE